MEYQIDIRPFKPEDQEALAGVIRRTWQYDRFCGPKTAQRLGRVYLRQCLTQQTFTRVAVVNGVRTLHGAAVKCTDLRGGAALVIAGLSAEGTTRVTELTHIDRGYDAIERDLAALGAQIRRETT